MQISILAIFLISVLPSLSFGYYSGGVGHIIHQLCTGAKLSEEQKKDFRGSGCVNEGAFKKCYIISIRMGKDGCKLQSSRCPIDELSKYKEKIISCPLVGRPICNPKNSECRKRSSFIPTI